MRRDWDCIRVILTAVESDPGFPKGDEDCTPWRGDKYARHIELAAEGGYLIRPRASHEDWVLSARGHQMVALMGSDDRWRRIKELAAEHEIPLMTETIEILARHVKLEEVASAATRAVAEPHRRMF